MLARWLADLVDPDSGEPLALESAHADGTHVLAGELRSAHARYPIVNGIPRFIPPSFYVRSGPAADDVAQTIQCYSDFWADGGGPPHHTESEIRAYELLLQSMLGLASPEELRDLLTDGTYCLDVGCGVGWSEYLFNVNPRAHRFAVDLSTSVEVAFERTRHLPNVLVAQADLFRLPFREARFDVIFAGGVLHHTGDARRAFAALCRHLRPGGLIGIFVYKVKPFLRELADRELKRITTAMSDQDCRAFASQLASLGRALQRVREPLVVEEDIPALGIRRGEYGVQKFVYDHFLKCYHNAALGHEHSVRANIDWYRPKVASHHTREEVESWFTENGVAPARFVDRPGWEHASFFVSGRKGR
jgi:SAM-dependent methyltransferase